MRTSITGQGPLQSQLRTVLRSVRILNVGLLIGLVTGIRSLYLRVLQPIRSIVALTDGKIFRADTARGRLPLYDTTLQRRRAGRPGATNITSVGSGNRMRSRPTPCPTQRQGVYVFAANKANILAFGGAVLRWIRRSGRR